MILLAGRGGNSTALVKADKNNWGPRVGFAYQIDNKTVLRSGYGVYYSPENDAREDVLTKNYPFNNQQLYFNRRQCVLRDRFPELSIRCRRSAGYDNPYSFGCVRIDRRQSQIPRPRHSTSSTRICEPAIRSCTT